MRFFVKASFSALLVLMLSGCLTDDGKYAITALPSLKQYDMKIQGAVADELPDVRECCPQTYQLVLDYYKLRRKIREAERIQRSGG